MSAHGDELKHACSARWRRERRLRAWWRHQQFAIWCAVASATHNSANKSRRVDAETQTAHVVFPAGAHYRAHHGTDSGLVCGIRMRTWPPSRKPDFSRLSASHCFQTARYAITDNVGHTNTKSSRQFDSSVSPILSRRNVLELANFGYVVLMTPWPYHVKRSRKHQTYTVCSSSLCWVVLG